MVRDTKEVGIGVVVAAAAVGGDWFENEGVAITRGGRGSGRTNRWRGAWCEGDQENVAKREGFEGEFEEVHARSQRNSAEKSRVTWPRRERCGRERCGRGRCAGEVASEQ